MIKVEIYRIKDFYANAKDDVVYSMLIDDKPSNQTQGLSREDLIELYHSIATFFKEVEKEDLK